MRRILLFGLLIAVGCSPMNATVRPAPPTTTQTADSIRVQQTATAFLAAFDSLQLDAFPRYFADDATMFFPFSEVPSRVNGRTEIESVFRRFFDQVRTAWAKRQFPGPPRLGIKPRDVRIQMLGDAAVVSFHLGDTQVPSRRTLVLRRMPEGSWKIVHLHASSAPRQPGS
jgi:ketosteroid isomerase-like protein